MYASLLTCCRGSGSLLATAIVSSIQPRSESSSNGTARSRAAAEARSRRVWRS